MHTRATNQTRVFQNFGYRASNRIIVNRSYPWFSNRYVDLPIGSRETRTLRAQRIAPTSTKPQCRRTAAAHTEAVTESHATPTRERYRARWPPVNAPLVLVGNVSGARRALSRSERSASRYFDNRNDKKRRRNSSTRTKTRLCPWTMTQQWHNMTGHARCEDNHHLPVVKRAFNHFENFKSDKWKKLDVSRVTWY